MEDRVHEMPQDLQDHIAAYPDLRIPPCEQPQPGLVFEKIHTGSLYSTAFFPVSPDGWTIFTRPEKTPMVVVIFIPGGFDEVNSGDENLCIDFVKRTGAIGIATGHPSGIENGIESMKEHLRSVMRDVLHLCDTAWKRGWGTDSSNVCIVTSSFAGVIAMDLVQIFSVLALGLIVPLFDTDPGSKQHPWGKNGNVPGLDTQYLLSSLDKTFNGVSRGEWENNPSEMPDSVRMKLPPIFIATAIFDPLYPSGKKFVNYQTELVKDRVWYIEVESVHQAKDLHQYTAEGANLRTSLVEFYRSFLVSDNPRFSHWPWQQGLLR